MSITNPLTVAGWQQLAGFTGNDAVTATAIALRSSAGDPEASGGLYGIGTTGDGPAQARAAYERQRGEGWEAFPAWRDRSYLLLVPMATTAVAGMSLTAPAAATVGAGVGGIEAVGQVAGWLTQPDAWQRIIKIGVGVIMIAIGGIMLATRTGNALVIQPLQRVVRGAGRVATESDAVRSQAPLTESR